MSSGRGKPPPGRGGTGSILGARAASQGASSGATGASGGNARQPSATQSLLPSRSASASRPGPARMVFRPRLPPRRPVVKEDPDGPSPAGSPAPSLSGSASVSPIQSRQNSPAVRPPGPRRSNRPSQPEMIASGPFAQGSGAVSRRDHSRPSQTANAASSSLRPSFVPSDRGESGQIVAETKKVKKEREEYSDQEDGNADYIDLEDIGELDELAPKSLPRTKREDDRKAQRLHTPKARGSEESSRSPSVAVAEKDLEAREADALDLSASEEEEMMDDLLDDFVDGEDGFDDDRGPENKMYLFQFPPLFPKFIRPAPGKEEPGKVSSSDSPDKPKARRSVAFAEGTLGGGGAAGASPAAESSRETGNVKGEEGLGVIDVDGQDKTNASLEGQVGRLDVYRDGRVLLKLGDGLVMEVTGGAQASFLQQVMILDADQARATTLGEVQRKFVVAPEISAMLADAELHSDDKARDPESMVGIR